MAYGLRAKCCVLADNMVEIEAWRSRLSEDERASQNNPETVIKHWRKATKSASPPRRRVTPHAANGNDRPVQSGDLIKRVGLAIKSAARSNDYFFHGEGRVGCTDPCRSHRCPRRTRPDPPEGRAVEAMTPAWVGKHSRKTGDFPVIWACFPDGVACGSQRITSERAKIRSPGCPYG